MQLTSNRLCRVFMWGDHRMQLKVDVSDTTEYDLDADVCLGKEIIKAYHVNIRNGCMFIYDGSTLFKTIPGRMSEVLDAIVRDFTQKAAPAERRGHIPRRF